MYARDLGIKKDFYSSLGLDAKEYDQYVINKTNETSARVFPVVLNVYDKSFYGRLDKIVENNKILTQIQNSSINNLSKKKWINEVPSIHEISEKLLVSTKSCLLYTSDAADE